MTVPREDSEAKELLSRIQMDLAQHVARNDADHQRLIREMDRALLERTKFREHLFGNGAVGVLERVRDVEEFIHLQKRMAWIVVPAVVLSALALVAQVVWTVVSEYPERFAP